MTEPGRPSPRPRIVDASAIIWLVAGAAFVVTVLWTSIYYPDVRDELTDSFAADHPAVDRGDVAATVDLIMIGNGLVALSLSAVAAVGVLRVRRRISSGRTMLTVVAALVVVVGVQFWLVSEPTHRVVGAVISVLPLVMAGCAAVGSALLHAPTVRTWLKTAPTCSH
jgi:hypothetical protein